MPDLTLNVKTLGTKDAIKSVKDINGVVKQMADLAKHSAFGDMNAKQVVKSDKLLKQFNTTQMQAVKLAKEYGAQVNVLNKALQQTEAIYGKSKEGRQKIKDLTAMRDEARLQSRRVQGAVNRGTGAAGELSASRDASNPAGAGGGSSLFGGISKGAGIGTMSMAAIGFIIGKGVSEAFSRSSQNFAQMTTMAGISRGNVGGFLARQSGFSSSLFGSNLNANVNSLGFSDSRAKILEAATSQMNAGATPTDKSVEDALAMSRMGVSLEQSGSLYKSTIAGMPATSSAFSPQNLRAGNKNAGQDLVNFRRVMSEAVTTGMSGVRSGEFVEGINKMVELTEKTAGSVNVNSIADIYAAANRMSTPALQGARGAENLATIQNSLLNPGGGVAGQMAALQAGGFGTSTNSVWQARKNLSKGLGAGNLGRLMGIYSGHGAMGEAAFAEQTGLSPGIASEILNSSYTPPDSKRAYTMADMMPWDPKVKGAKEHNRLADSLMGRMDSDNKSEATRFRELIKQAGPAAQVDITKKEMLNYIMDPLVAIANSVQKAGTYSFDPKNTVDYADGATERMAKGSAKGSSADASMPMGGWWKSIRASF